MNKSLTIEDIARQAGVSTSTVSRVLNGTKAVAEDKRARVLAVIEEHQFRPNAVARGLVRGRSMTVGVLVQDINSSFFASLVAGIEQGLDSAAYRPMLTTTHWRSSGQENETRSLELLLERRVDGLLVLASRIPDETLREVARAIPTVIVARHVPGLDEQCLYVDNENGGYRVTRYLIGLGHSRIAHITGTIDQPDAIARLQGYRRALHEASLPIDEQLIVEGEFTSESGQAALEQLLMRGQRFTAVFAANDQAAYGAMLGLFNHGYHIPADVSLVGFDDVQLSAFTLPPLTTMRQPAEEMGKAAAEGLLRLIDGKDPQLPRVPMQLVIRQSTMRLQQDGAVG